MKLFKRVLQAIAYLFPHFIMMFAAWLLSPVLPLFANDDDRLPNWLSWFQTPDNTLDGEGQFNDKPEYIRRVLWIIRNPAYGFAWSVLAAELTPKQTVTVYGDIDAKENPYKAGWTFIYCKDTGHFSCRLFLPTFKNKCLKARCGWKLRGKALGSTEEKWKYVFTFNPFKDRNDG